MSYRLEYDRLWNAFSISMRQSKNTNADGSALCAGNLRSKSDFEALLKKDRAFSFLKDIRGSPPYWKRVMDQVLAMVKNFGKPTWFFTLSCYDTGWEDMIGPIFERAHGRKPNQTELEEMSWAERCNMLRKDPPVYVCRHFQYRFNEFCKQILLNSEVAPLGKVIERFWRVEFQARGSPHIHGLLWVEGAPEINKNTEQEICDFIDKHITCEIPSEEDDKDLHDKVMKLQLHKHRKTCQKGKSLKKDETCRFHFPKEFCEKTHILGLEKIEEQKQHKEGGAEEENEISRENEDFSEEQNKPIKYKTGSKLTVEIRRMPEENMIVPYNPIMSRSWNANLDCQFILNVYAVVVYILSYVCKAEAEMSTMMRSATESLPDSCSAREYLKTGCHAFLTGREVGLVESVYRSCSSQLLRFQSCRVQHVPTGFPEDRVRLLKEREALGEWMGSEVSTQSLRHFIARLDDGDTEIYYPNLLDRYGLRAKEHPKVKTMCLAQFAAFYQPASKRKSKLIDIEEDKEFEEIPHAEDVEDSHEWKKRCKTKEYTTDGESLDEWPALINAGGAKYARRNKRCALKYHAFSAEDEPDKHYYTKALLFMPWTDEETDLEECRKDPKTFFQKNYTVIHENMKLFEPENIDEIEEAVVFFENNEECLNEVLNEMYPEGMAAFGERKEAMGDDEIDDEFAVPQFGAHTIPEPTDIIDEMSPEKPKSEFIKTELLTEEAYSEMVAQIKTNPEQSAIFEKVNDWCEATVESRRSLDHPKPPQLLLYVSGPGGTGKSFLLKAIRQSIQRVFAQNYGHQSKPGEEHLCARQPDELVVIVGAYTGKAARNVHGQTLHSALGLTVQKGSSETKHMTAERQQYYKNIYSNVEVLMIDEVSMLSIHQLYEIHERMQTFRSEYVATSTKVFGGVGVIAFGNFYQLPPIGEPMVFKDPTRSDIKLKALAGHLWRDNFERMDLTTIVRQKGDKEFAEMLNRIREEKQTQDDIKKLQGRVFAENQCPNDCPRIFAVNSLVIAHNEKCLRSLTDGGAKLITIVAEDRLTSAEISRQKRRDGTEKVDLLKLVETRCDNGRDTGGLVTTLSVCTDARVILLKNIKVTDGLCNGTMGSLRAITKRRQGDSMPVCVWVEFDKEGDFVPGMQQRKEWLANNASLMNHLQNISSFSMNEISDDWTPIGPSVQEFCSSVNKRVSITRTQIPLTLCYACTFHKVQGQTLNKIVVSFEGKSAKMHTPGAACVALSRVTSLNGLYLLNHFDPNVIRHSVDVDLEIESTMNRTGTWCINDVHLGNKYGLSYQDLHATRAARVKEQKEMRQEQDQMEPNSSELAAPPTSILKAIECACSRPNSYYVNNFADCMENVSTWISDKKELLYQIELFYHNNIIQLANSRYEDTFKSNRKAKEKFKPIPGYKIIYTQQNGNSSFCALSILMCRNMKLERTLRALTVATWVRMAKTDTTISQLQSLSSFKQLFVRGNEPCLEALFCFCCSVGCHLTIIELNHKTNEYEGTDMHPIQTESSSKIPFLGYILHEQGRWWAVCKIDAKARSYRKNKTWDKVKSSLTMNTLLGHEWNMKSKHWAQFHDAKCYIPKSKTPKQSMAEQKDQFDKKTATTATTKTKWKPSVRRKVPMKYKRRQVNTFQEELLHVHNTRVDNNLILSEEQFGILSEMHREARALYPDPSNELRPGLTPESFLDHLEPNGWLGDQSFTKYMSFLKTRQAAYRPNKPKCFYMDTLFWPRLERMEEMIGSPDFEDEKEITMRYLFPRSGNSVFEYDYVFVPVNLPGLHWLLAVIDNGNQRITCYDSLGEGNQYFECHSTVIPLLRLMLSLAGEMGDLQFEEDTFEFKVDEVCIQQYPNYGFLLYMHSLEYTPTTQWLRLWNVLSAIYDNDCCWTEYFNTIFQPSN